MIHFIKYMWIPVKSGSHNLIIIVMCTCKLASCSFSLMSCSSCCCVLMSACRIRVLSSSCSFSWCITPNWGCWNPYKACVCNPHTEKHVEHSHTPAYCTQSQEKPHNSILRLQPTLNWSYTYTLKETEGREERENGARKRGVGGDWPWWNVDCRREREMSAQRSSASLSGSTTNKQTNQKTVERDKYTHKLAYTHSAGVYGCVFAPLIRYVAFCWKSSLERWR